MNIFSWLRGKRKSSISVLPLLYNQYKDTPISPGDYPKCDCFTECYGDDDENIQWTEKHFHVDELSKTARAWDIVREIFDKAKIKGTREINLGKLMDRHDYKSLNTLPDTIGNLKDLEKLIIYGSDISSIPTEISGCEKLTIFEPYTSYRLHWLPYEIKYCKNLTKSCISTRALYGNYKYNPPFPNLKNTKWQWPQGKMHCSICKLETNDLQQYWISQNVATDVMPLLVSVCSDSCREKIGDGEIGYAGKCHQGGINLQI